MRLKVLDIERLSSTRIGRRPCSSGSRSDGLRDVEGAGGDEQDVVALHRPVLGRDRGALDQRQQVALHALARDIGAAAALAAADLVDLVEEDDAVVLDLADRRLGDRVLVDQLVALLGEQRRIGVLDEHALGLAALAEGLAEHVGEVDRADRGAGHAGYLEHRQRPEAA
jgi:hypothetical protein